MPLPACQVLLVGVDSLAHVDSVSQPLFRLHNPSLGLPCE